MPDTPTAAAPLPTTPPTSVLRGDEVALLLQFVHNRDVHCPRCDYNLRNLTQPYCPECREELRLAVGSTRPRIGLLIAALAPGIFSGICAFFMGGMLVIMTLSPRGRVIWQPVVLDAFGWLSAIIAIALFVRRYKFLKQSVEVQATLTAVIWFIHVGFFLFMWTRMR